MGTNNRKQPQIAEVKNEAGGRMKKGGEAKSGEAKFNTDLTSQIKIGDVYCNGFGLYAKTFG